ncbi:hypothetical protein K8089_05740 [Aequorivita sp. F47161]|uniref:DUF4382 domain-containing protein n=1 Tax=Aequorivita vitellina TaxID=2874475 RepID=A0A9X1U2G1_9FLAO|nr:DUF6252 family protein [Aequorivita vitellina]MCG2418518.1 hypothetical protein [Aequorivita vitellina]MCZ4319830.1 DUF6252 family protein [Aequorivita viscosa]
MKTFNKTILVLMAVLAVSLTSCKKDDDGGDDPQGGTGTFSAKVDGDSFSGIQGTVVAQLTNSGSTQVLAVSGGTMDSENLQMIIQNFDGEGTYNLNFMNIGTYSYLPDPGNPDPNTVVIYTTVGDGQGNNGTISISSFDGNTVKGTFSFTGINLNDNSDTVSVTEGQFNIEVTNN